MFFHFAGLSIKDMKTSEEDLRSSNEALVPPKSRSRRGSMVGQELLKEKKEFDDEDNNTNSVEGLNLPDIDSFQRSGSRKSRKSFKEKKNGGEKDPYPKRKGSYRRYSCVPKIEK